MCHRPRVASKLMDAPFPECVPIDVLDNQIDIAAICATDPYGGFIDFLTQCWCALEHQNAGEGNVAGHVEVQAVKDVCQRFAGAHFECIVGASAPSEYRGGLCIEGATVIPVNVFFPGSR